MNDDYANIMAFKFKFYFIFAYENYYLLKYLSMGRSKLVSFDNSQIID